MKPRPYAGRLQGEVVSGNYFTLLGVRTSQGRLFTDDDDRTPNAHPVAVMGEAFWKGHLGADPNVVGQLVKLNGTALTVIGIVPGCLGAYLLAPVIDRLLMRMPATDPVTFAGTAVLLATTTLMACYLPARRATRVDALVALRTE